MAGMSSWIRTAVKPEVYNKIVRIIAEILRVPEDFARRRIPDTRKIALIVELLELCLEDATCREKLQAHGDEAVKRSLLS